MRFLIKGFGMTTMQYTFGQQLRHALASRVVNAQYGCFYVLPFLLAITLASPVATAADKVTAPKTPTTRAAPPRDIKAGEQLAHAGKPPSVAACASCHGAQGEGLAAFPPLGGTGYDYLLAQLNAFADGSRQNAVMGPIAKALSAGERASAAAYFSQLPARVQATVPPPPAPSDTGGWLAQRGRWADNLPACAQCHGPAGEGVGSAFPPIAHLPAAYLQAQIQAWTAGTRPPGPLGLMQGIARKLNAQDVQALAGYYSQLQAQAAAPAAAKRAPQGARP